ncbi:MAG: hypothetical protein U9P72_00205 [Campylobacterota bacterium]|nr:hypothetical protein [Campylobacterota bacterium]
MLDKLLELLYLKVFINIVVKQTTTAVYIKVSNKNGTVDTDEKVFEVTDLSDKMYEFIKKYTKLSPYYYISVLDNSELQGAIPTCDKHKISDFLETASLNNKCYENRWSYYTTKDEINNIKNRYKKIGVDFIFSPTIVLNNFFKDKIDTHMALFILVEDNYLSISVFDNSKLLFALHLDVENDNETHDLFDDSLDDMDMDMDMDLDLEDSVDLDDMDSLDDMEPLDDTDLLDGMDDFGDIEDLDSFDEIDEFAEAKDMEEELAEELENTDMEAVEDEEFTEDYHRFAMIQSAVNSFYKDERFNSQFIDNVYIADGIGVSRDLKKYIEDEMFLNVYVRNIDTSVELSTLAQMELE